MKLSVICVIILTTSIAWGQSSTAPPKPHRNIFSKMEAYFDTAGVHPYLGVAVNWPERGFLGGGINAGIKFKYFYFGGEYGGYGQIVNSTVRPLGVDPQGGSSEIYYGVHAGVVLDSDYLIGIVFLQSKKLVAEDGIDECNNLGIDLRIQSARHLIWAFAYSLRRGPNVGFDILL